MGKSKSEIPEAPDYTASAQKQAGANMNAWQDALIANRPNQVNQYGSQTWTQDPTTGQWQQTNTLNSGQQGVFDRQQHNQYILAGVQGGGINGYDAGQVDLSNAAKMPGVADYSSLNSIPAPVDYGQLGDMPKVGQYSQQATDLYNQLAQPNLDRQRAAKEAQMAAMGLSLGSGRAWNNEQFNLNDSENRSGMMGAQAGIQQGNTMFGQGMQRYQQGAQNLNNQFAQGMQGRQQGVSELNNQFTQGMGIHSQGVNDILNQKSANINQLQGLMGLGQQVGAPSYNSFSPTGAYQVPDQTAAQQAGYNANLQGASARNADSANNQKSAMQGIGTAASVAAAFGF